MNNRALNRSVIIRRIAAEFAPYRGALLLAATASVGVSACEGLRIFLIKDVLDGLLSSGATAELSWLPIAIAFVTVLSGLLEAARGWFARQPTFAVMRDLRTRLFVHLQSIPLQTLQRYPAGDLASRLTHDVGAINQGQTVLITLLQKPLTLVVMLATALWHEPLLTAVGVLAVPLIGLPVVLLSQRLRRQARAGQMAHGVLQTQLYEDLQGVRVVRASGQDDAEARRFETQNEGVYKAQLHGLAARLTASPLVSAVAAVGAAAVLTLGAGRVASGESTAGSLIAFLLALGFIYDPIKSLTQLPLLIEQCSAGLERVFEVLDETPERGDRHIEGAHTPVDLHADRLSVTWQGVWLDYGEGPILQGVDAHVEPGEMLGVMGPSGSGKSSLIDLVPRLVEPSRGVVRVGGYDTRELSLSSLRQHIALVTQDTFLFHETIANNIAFGSRADISEIRAAAGAAGAAGFIDALPMGYDTVVGDRGCRLSGGEAQRIALARAFLRDAPILLLDEATAHLDAETEGQILQTLRGWRDRTIVVISHRETLTPWVDRVLRLSAGQVEAGLKLTASDGQEVA